MRATTPPFDLLRLARDRSGQTPEEWLAAGLSGAEGPVLEIRCALDRPETRVAVRRLPARVREPATPVATLPHSDEPASALPGPREPDRTIRYPGEPGRALPHPGDPGRALPYPGEPGRALPGTGAALADARWLPVPTNAAAALGAVMCLPTLEPLDALFAELRRVLRPTGTLAALVPSAPRPLEPATWPRSARAALRALTRALGGHPGFRHRAARDRVSWLLASADFAVLTDHRRVFWVEVSDPASAAWVVAGLAPAGVWPPGVESERTRRAAAALADIAGPGVRLPLPLRLVLGRR